MKNRIPVCFASMLLVALAVTAQGTKPPETSPAASNRSDLYQVHFVKATPGKAAELLNSLRTPAADAVMPTHALILRHLEGDDWDFAVIQHLG